MEEFNHCISFSSNRDTRKMPKGADTFDICPISVTCYFNNTCFMGSEKVQSTIFYLARSFENKISNFFAHETKQFEKLPKLIITMSDLGFQTQIFPKPQASIVPSTSQSTALPLKGPVRWEKMRFDSRVGKRQSKKTKSLWFSDDYFCTSMAQLWTKLGARNRINTMKAAKRLYFFQFLMLRRQEYEILRKSADHFSENF